METTETDGKRSLQVFSGGGRAKLYIFLHLEEEAEDRHHHPCLKDNNNNNTVNGSECSYKMWPEQKVLCSACNWNSGW